MKNLSEIIYFIGSNFFRKIEKGENYSLLTLILRRKRMGIMDVLLICGRN